MGINGHQSSLQSRKKLSKMLTIYFIASVVMGVYFLYEIYSKPSTSLFDIIFKTTLSLQELSNTTTNNKDRNLNYDN